MITYAKNKNLFILRPLTQFIQHTWIVLQLVEVCVSSASQRKRLIGMENQEGPETQSRQSSDAPGGLMIIQPHPWSILRSSRITHLPRIEFSAAVRTTSSLDNTLD